MSQPDLEQSFYDINRMTRPIYAFLSETARGFTSDKRAYVVVTHLMKNAEPFIDALSQTGRIAAIIPKQKTYDKQVAEKVGKDFPICNFSRTDILQPGFIAQEIGSRIQDDEKLIVMDIGGYFAPVLKDLSLIPNFAGIVEDTDNGAQKYNQLADHYGVKVYSCADSILKRDLEDYKVGEACMYGGLRAIAESGIPLNGKNLGCLGMGDVGRAILPQLLCFHELSGRSWGYDLDPNYYKKWDVYGEQRSELGNCAAHERDYNLGATSILFCMTGNHSLKGDDFHRVRRGSFIVSCTSRDDEFDIETLDKEFTHHEVAPHIHRYDSSYNSFYMVNNGNAANFIYPKMNGDMLFPDIHGTHAALIENAKMLDRNEPVTEEKLVQLSKKFQQKTCDIKLASGFKNISLIEDQLVSLGLVPFYSTERFAAMREYIVV